MTRAVRVITAKPGSNSTYLSPRTCKGCRRPIEAGERCVRYQRHNRFKYHCWECALKYNPVAVGEEIYFP